MAQLIDGRKYRLPNGQTVTARSTSDGFLLEFRRKSAAPIVVDPMGILIHKGEALRLMTDHLVEEADGDHAAGSGGVEDFLTMVLAVHDCGGEAWESMQGAIRAIYGEAMLTRGMPQGDAPVKE